nr:hypothetical protein HK105_003722 [Polyrhizophydium stewartii]
MIPQTRSDLLILQESEPDSDLVTLRVWDPREHHNGPWLQIGASSRRVVQDSAGRQRIPGLWILPHQARGAVLCGRTLVCRPASAAHHLTARGVVCWLLEDARQDAEAFDDSLSLHTPETPETADPGSHSTDHTQTLLPSPARIVWQRVEPDMSIQQIVSSETAVGVRAILTGQAQTGARIAVQIWSAATGETLADISSDIPTSLVSGSGIFRLLMTRFHLGLYNAETLAVETPPSQLNASTGLISRVSGLCSISKLSSLGRDIRIDVSDDGTVAIVGPLQTRGELAVIDMDRLSCTTYLLDDAFAEGSHGDGYGPKPPLIVAWQRISL